MCVEEFDATPLSFHSLPLVHLAGLSDVLFTMSCEGHITFASVPALANLPEIQQQPGSVSKILSPSIDLEEGCFLTKSVKYTHQLTHWVNVVHSGDPKELVSRKLIGDYSPQLLNVISFRNVLLNLI
jgi:hypothetical protein